jgi:hypothetical protein
MTWLSFTDVQFLYLFMLDLIISCMSCIFKSSCRVWFETYHGAPDIIRSVLDWKGENIIRSKSLWRWYMNTGRCFRKKNRTMHNVQKHNIFKSTTASFRGNHLRSHSFINGELVGYFGILRQFRLWLEFITRKDGHSAYTQWILKPKAFYIFQMPYISTLIYAGQSLLRTESNHTSFNYESFLICHGPLCSANLSARDQTREVWNSHHKQATIVFPYQWGHCF